MISVQRAAMYRQAFPMITLAFPSVLLRTGMRDFCLMCNPTRRSCQLCFLQRCIGMFTEHRQADQQSCCLSEYTSIIMESVFLLYSRDIMGIYRYNI